MCSATSAGCGKNRNKPDVAKGSDTEKHNYYNILFNFFWSILCLHTSITFTAETVTDSSKFSLNRFTIICKNWHIPPIKAKFPLAISEENRLRECGYLSQPSTFIHLGNYHFIMLSKRACREIHHWWTNHHGSPPPLMWVWGASSCPRQAFVTAIWQGPGV